MTQPTKTAVRHQFFRIASMLVPVAVLIFATFWKPHGRTSALPAHTTAGKDIDLEVVKIRLDLIKGAVARSRAAFIAITIASVALIVAAFNAYLSSYRSFPLGVNAFDLGTAAHEAETELVKQWVDSLWITIAPLGIRIGIGDAAVLGAGAVYIIAVWMFFCVRRENRAVANLFYDIKGQRRQLQELAHHAIAENMLFLSVRNDDEPLRSIRDIPRTEGRRAVLLRRSLRFLFSLPAIAVLFVLGLDLASLFFMAAVFRTSHEPIIRGLLHHPDNAIPDITKFLGMTFIEVILAIMILKISRRILAFENAITDLIRESQEHLTARPSRE